MGQPVSVYLATGYSECDLWTSSTDIIWELINNAESQTLAESESSFLKDPQVIDPYN